MFDILKWSISLDFMFYTYVARFDTERNDATWPKPKNGVVKEIILFVRIRHTLSELMHHKLAMSTALAVV